PAVNDPRLGNQQGHETHPPEVERKLIDDALGIAAEPPQRLQIEPGEPQGRGLVELPRSLRKGLRNARETAPSLAQPHQFHELPGSEDPRMAREDLLDQGGAGPRQAHDEHRQLAAAPEAGPIGKELGIEDFDTPEHQIGDPFRFVAIAPQCVTLSGMGEGALELARSVVRFSQGEVKLGLEVLSIWALDSMPSMAAGETPSGLFSATW